jgi:hypothetical protein
MSEGHSVLGCPARVRLIAEKVQSPLSHRLFRDVPKRGPLTY